MRASVLVGGSLLLACLGLVLPVLGEETVEYLTQGVEVKHLTFRTSHAAVPYVDPHRALRVSGLAPFIINGTMVQNIQDYPFVVALVVIDDEGGHRPFCTGGVLDEKLVLTAAHCLAGLQPLPDNYTYAACSGAVDITVEPRNCASFASAFVPAQYNNTRFFDGYDLAVLNLTESILMGPVRRMRLSFQKPTNEEPGVSIGYGVTNGSTQVTDGKLREVNTTVVLNEGQCRLLNENMLEGDSKLVCGDVSGTGKEGSTCSGDSGSPLLVPGELPTDAYAVGVLSFGVQGCNTTIETAYSSLYDGEHSQFVLQAVQNFGGTIRRPPTESSPPTPPVGPQCEDAATVRGIRRCMEELAMDCRNPANPNDECYMKLARASNCVRRKLAQAEA